MTATAISLSRSDSGVLRALFDPESSPSSGIKIEADRPALPGLSASEFASLETSEREAVRPLNREEPARATVSAAIRELSDLIDREPSYASAYANRAQALRLRLPSGASLFGDPRHADDVNMLFSDLSRAIALATPASTQEPLSPYQAKTLAAAHSHRGYLYLKAASFAPPRSPGQTGPAEDAIDALRALDRDALEELASRDFFLGGRYGDKLAAQMAVRTNPYAKMCGAIVKEAMRKDFADSRAAQTTLIDGP